MKINSRVIDWKSLPVVEIQPSDNSIQNELTKLGEAGGGTLHLCNGIYVVESTILIPSYVRIIGDGPSTLLQLDRGANCHLLTNKDQNEGNQDIWIENLSIDGAMDYQTKPEHIKTLTFACGILFKNTKNIIVNSLNAFNIRQTAVHLSGSQAVNISGLRVDRVGWSGLSSSEASNVSASGSIKHSGLDVMHSGVHMDGGVGVALNFEVEDSTGNGIMLDSAFSAMGMVSVKGSATNCKRGLSFSGSAKNQLERAYVSGHFFGNREVGVMISNSEGVVIANSLIYDNKEVGLLFQGRNGGNKNIVVDTKIYNNGIDVEERHSSKHNFIVRGTVESNKQIIRSSFANRDKAKRASGLVFFDEGGIHACSCLNAKMGDIEGVCSTCGSQSIFQNNNKAIRESFRCSNCEASVRHRAQADAIVRCFGRGRVRSLKELSINEDFRRLKIYEPGIVGPNRKYFSTIAGYQTSYYWKDIPLGSCKDGIQNEDLMGLTFPDNHFDLVITSDILEHVRKPWKAFSEIARVLKPGGVHVFSIPALEVMPVDTKYRVDTSGLEDVFTAPPHYHIAGDGGKSLVYTDFGSDMFSALEGIGTPTITMRISDNHPDISRVITFVSMKNDGLLNRIES